MPASSVPRRAVEAVRYSPPSHKRIGRPRPGLWRSPTPIRRRGIAAFSAAVLASCSSSLARVAVRTFIVNYTFGTGTETELALIRAPRRSLDMRLSVKKKEARQRRRLIGPARAHTAYLAVALETRSGSQSVPALCPKTRAQVQQWAQLRAQWQK